MVNYTYTAKDLEKRFIDVLGVTQQFSLNDFSLTEEEYSETSQLIYDYIENNLQLTAKTLNAYKFTDIIHFQHTLVKAYLYNAAQTSKVDTLRDVLFFYYEKVKRFHANDQIAIPYPPDEGSIYNYLMSYKIEWFFTIGW
jgi:hypothetical protein